MINSGISIAAVQNLAKPLEQIVLNERFFSHWRPSAHARRHYAAIDRYYNKCKKVAGGNHSLPRHVKQYHWLLKHDY